MGIYVSWLSLAAVAMDAAIPPGSAIFIICCVDEFLCTSASYTASASSFVTALSTASLSVASYIYTHHQKMLQSTHWINV